jgi:phthiocerol/phenolphthiocerol synthesis type-I polyketide synthase E
MVQEAFSGDDLDSNRIAIVGFVGRFPGAANTDAFWHNLKNGVESIGSFSAVELAADGVAERLYSDPRYVNAAAILEDIDAFDAPFFGYAPREAALMDPQQRIFLESSWEALEHAGYNPDTYTGRIGVFAGASVNTYLIHNLSRMRELLGPEDLYATMLANEKDFLATRVAYKCNLRGPAITVQTACSTSLVATHLACQSLLTGETDMTLAGGVSIHVPHKAGYIYQDYGILSPDGHCRAFDAAARGTVAGSGVGIVVLKRLADALQDHDHIYAVILGSAVNNDGALKAGYTAPSEEGQAGVISEALSLAGVLPETISYIETHGTGTALGDPIEIAALSRVFGGTADGQKYCALGSVKTNVGHLDAAAGVTNLIKTSLMLTHQQIPPSLHFEQPNPNIDFASSPFYVNTQLAQWDAGTTLRRAGVSSFGVGGTNVHMILEEAPDQYITATNTSNSQLLLLSAKTSTSLQRATANLAQHFREHPEQSLGDVAYTLQVGRKAFPYRSFLVSQQHADAITVLAGQAPERLVTAHIAHEKPAIVFLFPGQGTQYIRMAYGLYQNTPVFRQHFASCAAHSKRITGYDLLDILYTSTENDTTAADTLAQTAICQLALFSVEYSLAMLWQAYGVTPAAMIGHSVGEYVAACLSGVFTPEDALTLLAIRGSLMQKQPAGAMLAVALSEQEIQPFLVADRLSLAVVNSPTQSVVAGPVDAIEQLERHLNQQGIITQRLHSSHAFHSWMMEPLIEEFTHHVQKVMLHPPRIPYISNVTGNWITAQEATDPAYWAKHLRVPVRFSQGIETLLHKQVHVFLEVGPGRALGALVRRHLAASEDVMIISSLRRSGKQAEDHDVLQAAIGNIWVTGVDIDWAQVHAANHYTRVPLPTYPFERLRYWLEPDIAAEQSVSAELRMHAATPIQPSEHVEQLRQEHAAPASLDTSLNEIEDVLIQMWHSLLGVATVSIHDDFFTLGGDSFMAVQLVNTIQKHWQIEVPLHSLIEASTIASLAALVQASLTREQQGQRISPTPLVVLQAGASDRCPLFCVHPAGGTVLCYLDLARHLDPDQPLYGLQSPGLYDGTDHHSLEEMAAFYITVISRVQPHGPYRLSGMSLGGNVAFEMARQLRLQGEETELLLLFDSLPPAAYHNAEPDTLELMAAFPWVLGLSMGRNLPPPMSREDVQRYDPQELLERVFAQIAEAQLFALDMNLQELRQFFRVWELHHHLLRFYDPPHKGYPGTIILFQAIEEQPAELLKLLKLRLTSQSQVTDWELVTSAPVQVFQVPGNHFTMLQEQHIHIIADYLNAHLSDRYQDK